MLTVSGLAKSHGARTLFRDVTFRLSPGRRIALVGANGVGKTTILEIVNGIQDADQGEVSRPKDYRIGYLPQELTEAWTDSVLREVMRGAGDVLALEAELRSLEERMTDPDEAAPEQVVTRYGEIQSGSRPSVGTRSRLRLAGSSVALASPQTTWTVRSRRCPAGGRCGRSWPGCSSSSRMS
ncbi:MAG: ATP-binding cassette domain-containing protein [Actinomycetota bacterium]